jgi:hypothetical protein
VRIAAKLLVKINMFILRSFVVGKGVGVAIKNEGENVVFEIINQNYQAEFERSDTLDAKISNLLAVSGVLTSLAITIVGLVINSKSTFTSDFDVILHLLFLGAILYGVSTTLCVIGMWPRKLGLFSIDTLEGLVDKPDPQRAASILMTSWLTFTRDNRRKNNRKGLIAWLCSLGILIGNIVLIYTVILIIKSQ